MNEIDHEDEAMARFVKERDLLLCALVEISNTDSRYGVHMQETASAAVRQFLESQVTT